MSNAIFTRPGRVGYFDTDARHQLLPQGILLNFQEMAIAHSEDIGASMTVLNERHRGWAVGFWHVKIHKPPVYTQALRLSTWVPRIRKMQAVRCFTMDSEAGETLCSAMSLWIYMDLEKRCPTLLPPEFIEGYQFDAPVPFAERFILPKNAGGLPLPGYELTVHRGDTDSNGHANNLRYMEWAMECVPDDLYETGNLEAFKVIYRKECYRGSRVTIRAFREDGPAATLIHVFLHEDDESGPVLAQVQFCYRC